MPDAPVVLVAGSLHHDIMVEAAHLPRIDETVTGTRWYPKFGGKGGNQAVSARAQGAAVRMVGALGDDGFGLFLRDRLRAGGVDDRFVRLAPGVGSGMSVALLNPQGDYAATIVSGANLTLGPEDLAPEAVWQDVGLLLLQNEIPEGANLAAATEARRRGLVTVLNAAPFRPLPAALAGRVDLVVVNVVEAEMMGAGAVSDLPSAEAAARRLAAQFGAVIVTAGAQGLALVQGGAALALPAVPVRAVSTHGAGDAFVGALAAGLVAGHALHDATRAAAAAAARHVAGLPPTGA